MRSQPHHGEPDSDQKAYYLLEHPEAYPGLCKREEGDRQFRLLQYPTFEPYASWSLFKAGQSYWVRRVEWDRSKSIPFHETDPYTYGCEAQCHQVLATEVITTLSSIEFCPLIRRSSIGLDGTTYGVSVGTYMQSCDLRWWCQPSEEWLELARWFRKTVEAFEELLPESSCRCVKLKFDF